MKLGTEHFLFGVAVGLTVWGIARYLERFERRPENKEFGARILRASVRSNQAPVSRVG